MYDGFFTDNCAPVVPTTTRIWRNSGDKAALKRQCMLLSENHDILSQLLAGALPWTTLSCSCGSAEVPKPLDALTNWINRPGKHPGDLKKHAMELLTTTSADVFTAGTSYNRTALLLFPDIAANVAASDIELELLKPADDLQRMLLSETQLEL